MSEGGERGCQHPPPLTYNTATRITVLCLMGGIWGKDHLEFHIIMDGTGSRGLFYSFTVGLILGNSSCYNTITYISHGMQGNIDRNMIRTGNVI